MLLFFFFYRSSIFISKHFIANTQYVMQKHNDYKGNYLDKMPSTNLKKIHTSPYRSFNFQQLFFYDIFFAQRVFYELSVVKVYDSQPIFLLIFWHNKKKVK